MLVPAPNRPASVITQRRMGRCRLTRPALTCMNASTRQSTSVTQVCGSAMTCVGANGSLPAKCAVEVDVESSGAAFHPLWPPWHFKSTCWHNRTHEIQGGLSAFAMKFHENMCNSKVLTTKTWYLGVNSISNVIRATTADIRPPQKPPNSTHTKSNHEN